MITVEREGFSIQGLTWNLLMWCRQAGDIKPSSNNPLNLGETPGQYLDRKVKQFREIHSILSSFESPHVFGLFQEADFTSGDKTDISKYHTRTAAWELFKTIVCDPLDLEYSCDGNNEGLLIVFSRSLAGNGLFTSNILPLEWNQQIAYKAHYARLDNVVLVCGHLEFNHDYSQELVSVLEGLNDGTRVVIFGADCNHPSGFGLPEMLTACDQDCTNYYSNYSQTPDKVPTEIELTDYRTQTLKNYDSFYVVGSCTATVSGQHKFERTPDGTTVVLAEISSSKTYTIQ